MIGTSQITIEQFSDPLITEEARGFACSQDSTLYFFNNDDEIYKIDNSVVSQIIFDCPSFCEIGGIAFDNNDNLLVGSEFGGLFRIIDDNNIEVLLDENITAVAVGPDGDIYAGSNSNFSDPFIAIFRNNSWTLYDESTSNINSALVYDVAVDSEGNAWFATFDGLLKFDGSSFSNYDTPALSVNFYDVEIDAEDNIWVASAFGGIGKFDGQWTIFDQFFNSLETTPEIELGADGSIWTYENSEGIFHIYEDEITLIPFEDLGIGDGFIVRGMSIDKNNKLWVSLDFSSELAVLSFNPTSSVRAIKELENFRLFPNPNSGEFTTTLDFSIPIKGLINIHDSFGKIRYSKILDKQANHNINFILDELAAGIYYISIVTDSGTKSYSFTILK